MHERSLVQSLLRQVERLMIEHGGEAVQEIAVEVGPLSGIETLQFREAFMTLTPGTPVDGARLTVQEVPLRARCQTCAETSTLMDFTFRCPLCGSDALNITQGDAVHLLQVTLRQGQRV